MKTLTEVLTEHPATFNHAIEKPWVCLGCMETGVAPVFATHADHAAHVAAAYREARTITTRDGLDALPTEAVICDDHGDKWCRAEIGSRPAWNLFGVDDWLRTRDIALPALVLWIPGEET